MGRDARAAPLAMEALAPGAALLLMGVVAPLWLAVGIADWTCHRILHIERSAGLAESSLHLLMLGELGVGVVAALFLELNAASFVLIFAACLVHELTYWADLRLAEVRRGIPWPEQWVHGLQESLPWFAFALLLLLDLPQALAAVGLGSEPARWVLEAKRTPVPGWYANGFLVAGAVLVLGPFVMEWLRAARHRRLRAVVLVGQAGS